MSGGSWSAGAVMAIAGIWVILQTAKGGLVDRLLSKSSGPATDGGSTAGGGGLQPNLVQPPSDKAVGP